MALKNELNDEDEIKSKDIQDIQLDFNFKLIKEIESEEKEKFKSLLTIIKYKTKLIN